MHSSMILASEKGQDEHHLGNEDVEKGIPPPTGIDNGEPSPLYSLDMWEGEKW